MSNRRDFIKTGTLALTGLTLAGTGKLWGTMVKEGLVSRRPVLQQRHFTSPAVEEAIESAKSRIGNPKLAWMFENCFPNTLDTTVETGAKNGKPDTFVITGDIHAMWLRDSSAQVWPYLPLAPRDEKLKTLLAGVIHRQTQCILLDPYANAFNKELVEGEWKSDRTAMKPGLHERKWEIDSLCYPVRLAYHYWKTTGDTSVFDDELQKAAATIVDTFKIGRAHV